MKDILLALVGLAVGVLLMAAPYYAEATLKAYAAYFFWGGSFLAAVFLAVVIAIIRRTAVNETEVVSVADQRGQLPTFEATRNSTIDATGATIPGDLPFQFAKADDHSVIAMPGLTVTKKDDGTMLVTPGSGPTRFPPPTGELTKLSNSDLKLYNQGFCKRLHDLQTRLTEATQNFYRQNGGQRDDVAFRSLYDPYVSEYRTKLVHDALSLASEFLSRINMATPTSVSAQRGATMILYKSFAGPSPASDAADFLTHLEQQLPI